MIYKYKLDQFFTSVGPTTELEIPNPGEYTLSVNVTNGLSWNITSRTFTVVAPITTISFDKVSPDNAASANQQFTLAVSYFQ